MTCSMRHVVPAALAGLLILLPSCSAPNSSVSNCDYQVAAGAQTGVVVPIETDQRCPQLFGFPLAVTVDILATGHAGSAPAPTTSDFFYPDHYVVTYTNQTTGGTRPGIDVPQPYEFPLPFAPEQVPFTSKVDGAPILSAEAKSAPPLNDSRYYNGGTVTLQATITVYGHPVNDTHAECASNPFYTPILISQSTTATPNCN